MHREFNQLVKKNLVSFFFLYYHAHLFNDFGTKHNGEETPRDSRGQCLLSTPASSNLLNMHMSLFAQIDNFETNRQEFLPSATILRQGNVFTPVCDSVHKGGGISVPACATGHITRGVSVQRGSLSWGVSVWGGSLSGRFLLGDLSRGVSVHCPRGSLSMGSLSRGLCLRGLCQGDPPYGNQRAVGILLEWIIVKIMFTKKVLNNAQRYGTGITPLPTLIHSDQLTIHLFV